MNLTSSQKYIIALRICNNILQHLSHNSQEEFELNFIQLKRLEKAWSVNISVRVLATELDNEKLLGNGEVLQVSMEDLYPCVVPRVKILKKTIEYSLSEASTSSYAENMVISDGELNCEAYDSDPIDAIKNEPQFNVQFEAMPTTHSRQNNQSSIDSLKQFLKYQNSLKYKCPTCDKILTTQRWYAKHNAVCARKKLLCTICGGHFLRKYYKLHLKRHSKLKDHNCTICGKGFVDRCGLKQHLISHGAVNNSVLCTACGKTFKHYTEFYRHNYEIHLGRRYKCETCGKEFARNHSLNLHKMRHQTLRNFKCGRCDKAFKTKDCLQRHMISHRSSLPFICCVCAKRFAQKHNLKMHLKTHGFTMDIIEKELRNQFVDLEEVEEDLKKQIVVLAET